MDTSVIFPEQIGLLESYAETLQERRLSPRTVTLYLGDIRTFANWLGRKEKTLAMATYEDTNRYFYSLYNKRFGKNNSVNRYLTSIRSFYRHLVARGMIAQNPTKNIHYVRHDPLVPEWTVAQEEFEAIMSAPDLSTPRGIRNRTILQLLCEAGGDISNILAVTVDQVDLANHRIVSVPLKRKQRHNLSLTEEATALLNVHMEHRRNALVGQGPVLLFVGFREECLTRQAFWYILQRYTQKVGIQRHVTSHNLQRAYVKYVLKKSPP